MKARATTMDAYNLLHKGALALAQAERNGIRVDLNYLNKTVRHLTKRSAHLKVEMRDDKIYQIWRKHYGDKIHLNSPKQIRHVVFDVLGYRPSSYTEKGHEPSVDDASLTRLGLPFFAKYLRVKKYDNLTTRLTGLRKLVVGDRFHPFFNLHTARTFRSSSGSVKEESAGASWNFQNIPVRDPELASFIRPCFIPSDEDWYLVERDFKGAEVVCSCAYNHDPVLIDYLRDPKKDMHRDAISAILLLSEREADAKRIRYQGKNGFVFPEFYGSVYFQCAPAIWEACAQLQLSDGTPLYEHLRRKGIKALGECDPDKIKEAGGTRPGTFVHHLKEFEEDFWGRRFKVYAQWKRDWYRAYLACGGFRMLTGFYVEGVYKRNEVVNYPIQGASFHCLLWCFTRLQEEITKRGMRTKLVGQVHDSILADVPEDELHDYLALSDHIVNVELPRAWKWIVVPMEIECEISDLGGSWHTKKEWKCANGVWGLPKEKEA